MPGPKCPNHQVPLQKTTTKGVGICPVSQYRFAYTANEGTKKRVVRTDGSVREETDYIVEGSDA